MQILGSKYRTLERKGFQVHRSHVRCEQPITHWFNGRFHKGPKFQRGILHPIGFWGGSAPPPVLTISGEAIVDIDAGSRVYRATAVLRTDGTLDKIENTATTQIDTSTDWMNDAARPPGTPGDFDTKYVLDSGDALHSSTSLAANTWGDLSADKFYEQRISGAAVESKFSTITVHISDDGGSSSADTGVFTLEVERLL